MITKKNIEGLNKLFELASTNLRVAKIILDQIPAGKLDYNKVKDMTKSEDAEVHEFALVVLLKKFPEKAMNCYALRKAMKSSYPDVQNLAGGLLVENFSLSLQELVEMQTLSDPAVRNAARMLALQRKRKKINHKFLIKKRESADDPNVIALIDELLEKNFQWKTKKEINAKKFVQEYFPD